jgi:hypothetical protein
MPRRILLAVAIGLCALGTLRVAANAQRAGAFMGSPDDPAISYSTAPLRNPVVEVNKRLEDGTLQLRFDGRSGLLASALDALQLPVDSQLLVFSRASLQGRRINEQNPRAIFFNDRVALGWVRDGDVIEVATHDESAGIVFYTLDQRAEAAPAPRQFKRAFECLGCHLSGDTLGVPGFVMFSTARVEQSREFDLPRAIDHSDPFARRFGGWFVTGSTGSVQHMGNDVAALDSRASRELMSTAGLFDADGYRALSSDIASHLVFTHQAGMANLLTRAGWAARVADRSASNGSAAASVILTGIAREVVDYLLFIDEARLADAVRGRSGFSERFAALGPRDRKGRSLHELDLNRRLMKYPCSYLIYSPAFDALPRSVRDPIYRRMWEVLSGQERDERYLSALSRADRQAIVEILRDTKMDLPQYFQDVTR